MTMFKVNILPKSLSAMVKLIKITTAKVKTTYAQKLAQDAEGTIPLHTSSINIRVISFLCNNQHICSGMAMALPAERLVSTGRRGPSRPRPYHNLSVQSFFYQVLLLTWNLAM